MLVPPFQGSVTRTHSNPGLTPWAALLSALRAVLIVVVKVSAE